MHCNRRLSKHAQRDRLDGETGGERRNRFERDSQASRHELARRRAAHASLAKPHAHPRHTLEAVDFPHPMPDRLLHFPTVTSSQRQRMVLGVRSSRSPLLGASKVPIASVKPCSWDSCPPEMARVREDSFCSPRRTAPGYRVHDGEAGVNLGYFERVTITTEPEVGSSR